MDKKLWRLILPPLFSLCIIMLAQGFFNTYVSIRLSIEGHGTMVIGIVNTCYFIGMVLGSYFMERFIHRIGHIRAFAFFASMNAATIITQSFIINIPSWMLFRFIVGSCAAGLFIVIESWLLLLSTTQTRGRLLSLYMLTIYAAQGTAQFILNLMPLQSYLPFASCVLLSSLSVIPVCVMRSGSPQMTEEPTMTTIVHLFKKAPFGVLGCLISGLILSAFYSLCPVFGKQTNLSVFQISQIMGFTILGGLALQWPIGHLSDLFERLKVILVVSFLLVGITFALFLSSLLSFNTMIILFILFGGLSFTIYPMSITFTCDRFSHKEIVSITSALYVIYGLGSIVGPLLAPLFMILIAPSALFLYAALLLILLIILGFSPLAKRGPPPEEGNYVSLLPNAPAAIPLDSHKDAPPKPIPEKPTTEE